ANDSGAPVGVAAPAAPLVADFDAGDAKAQYGLGFVATDDKMRGGNSSVSQAVVANGAENSHGALEVSGDIGTGIPYPFAGTTFLPNGSGDTPFDKTGYMDYSKKQTLRFFARGDGHTYMVLFMGPVLGAIPAMHAFTPGADWQEVRVPLQDLAGVDLKRVKI